MGPCLPPSLKLRRPLEQAPAKPWRRRVAGTTTEHASSFSRLISPEFCNFVVPFEVRGRRESRALTAPVDPVRRSTRASHVRSTWATTTGTAETSRLSPRNGFTAYFVLSPVSGVDCHRCLRDILPQNRRHGRGARTTRLRRTLRAFRPALFTPNAAASIATRANVP